jgi:potassium-dependent mechanosensitive channel
LFANFFNELSKIFDSEHPFRMMLIDVWQAFLSFWDYKVFVTADKQAVMVNNIIIGIILLIFGMKFVKRINKIFKTKIAKIVTEESLVNTLERLSYYFFLTIMVIFVLDVSNVPLTIFTVIGTTLALGIGLGSQNIVNNFISGIIIMIEQPIKVGDIIEVKGIAGKVTNIGARCTSIMTSKNINILVPNSNILQDVIINWTHEDTILKVSFELILSNNKTIEELEEIIMEVLKNHIYILSDPLPNILVKELCSNGYVLDINFWIDLALNLKSSLIINDLNRRLDPIFKEKKIKIIDREASSSSTSMVHSNH